MVDVLRRVFLPLARMVVTVFLVATISFVVVRVIPGDPAVVIAGIDASPDRVDSIRRELGTDRPMYTQYGEWLSGLAVGDFGESLARNRSVSRMIAERIPVTLTLAGAAFLITLVLSIPLGLRAAVHPNGPTDRLLGVFSHVGLAIPDFWVGIILLLIFAVGLRALPLFGASTVRHFVLPAVALAMSRAALLARVVRASVRAELQRPYIDGIRARGVSAARLMLRHVLPNALLPVITVAAVQLGYLLGGAIIIEQVFSMPGLGRLILSAVFQRDFPVVQAGVMFIAVCFSAINFFADLLYGLADPRVRRGS
ncbi:MAG: ABC transporter permease [bacterium]